MSSSLCQVASFTNVAEAEWARCRLGHEGILARLDNTNLVLWFWQYSLLTGGVKLLTKANDAPRARQILEQQPPSESTATWVCSTCNETLPGDWVTCWQCGTARDHVGNYNDSSPEDAFPDTAHQQINSTSRGFGILAVIIACVAGLMMYSMTRSLFAGLLGCLTALITQALLTFVVDGAYQSGKLIENVDQDIEPELTLSPAEQSQERRHRMGNFLTTRACRSAMFGLVWFFPLVFCSLITLLRIQPTRMLVRWPDRLRYFGTWGLIIIVVIWWSIPLLSRLMTMGMTHVELLKYLYYTFVVP